VGSKNGEEKALGSWASVQRANKKNKKLDDDKIKKLETIKEWYWEYDDKWDEKFNDLIKFINDDKNKDKKLPSYGSKNGEEKALGNWASSQRKNKKNKKLDDDKIKKLETIEQWYWVRDDGWDEQFNSLVDYVNKNNKIPTESRKNKEECALRRWVNRQVKFYKNQTLSDDKRKKMENIEILELNK